MTTNYLRILQHFSRVGILFATGGEGCNSKARALDQVAMRFLVWNWRPPAVFGEGVTYSNYPKKGAPAELPRLVLVLVFYSRHFFGCFLTSLNNLGEYIHVYTLFCSIIWGANRYEDSYGE